MEEQSHYNYKRIAEAIEYLRCNFQNQPKLEEIASKINLSSYHFHRLFNEWVGTTPKKFLQYISLEHAKKLLREEQITLFDAAYEIGLSGTGRLHDLFIKIEGMTPAEYKKGGSNLSISYDYTDSQFGKIIVASTKNGVCYMAFEENEIIGLNKLKLMFPEAKIQRKIDSYQQNALLIFKGDWDNLSEIKLHLKATEFQLKVWECLLKIPMGKLSTYGNIAKKIGVPNASRAVGTAIGKNPIAFLIPCHRVIQSTGNIGNYMWGSTRKSAIIGWECAKTSEIRCINSIGIV